MGVLDQIIHRAATDPLFCQRLAEDVAGTIAREGYDISPAEVLAALRGSQSIGSMVEELHSRTSYAGGREP